MEFSFLSLFVLSVSVILIIRWLFCAKESQDSPLKRICVIVLGDVGRSPRMQYHALSFAKEGCNVDLVGYGNSPIIQELRDYDSVQFYALRESLSKPNYAPQTVYYVLKTMYLFGQLVLLLLFKTQRHSFVLVQNPPAIPTLAAAWCICVLRQSKLVIDWHNYGYTILSLSLGNANPLVRLSKVYEGAFGRRAAHNICVTDAMKRDLRQRWNVTSTTLYDRPPSIFQTVDLMTRHKLFVKLSADYSVFKKPPAEHPLDENILHIPETRFSTLKNDIVNLKEDRPALLVSSTSWTEDEDFSILLKALELYDQCIGKTNMNLPNIVCVITGKGPLKKYYQEIIAGKIFQNVQISTPWLESSDYPKLVGSADLGICLHTSSSGLDLPMKVVDMFGCGVPVCAIGFPCLPELVRHGENGLVFKNAEQLAEQLKELLNGFPVEQNCLDKFRENLKAFQQTRWHPCWMETFYNTIVENN